MIYNSNKYLWKPENKVYFIAKLQAEFWIHTSLMIWQWYIDNPHASINTILAGHISLNTSRNAVKTLDQSANIKN